ncbi:MAG: hypothetical protein AABY22_33510, partial [Nanoarchaeota archaeon]
LRIKMPLAIQPEYGPVLVGWQSIDSSYLNDHLKEEKNPFENNEQFKSFSGMQAFYEMVRQDRQEYKDEGRHSEISTGRKKFI